MLLLLLPIIIPSISTGQESADFMIIKDEEVSAVVTMTRTQLDELAKQPDISLMNTPKVTSAAQIAIPLSSSLGGGFIIANPETLAKVMNANGLSERATAKSITEAVVAEKDIAKGASDSGKSTHFIVKNGKEIAGVSIILAGLASLIAKSTESSTTTSHH